MIVCGCCIDNWNIWQWFVFWQERCNITKLHLGWFQPPSVIMMRMRQGCGCSIGTTHDHSMVTISTGMSTSPADCINITIALHIALLVHPCSILGCYELHASIEVCLNRLSGHDSVDIAHSSWLSLMKFRKWHSVSSWEYEFCSLLSSVNLFWNLWHDYHDAEECHDAAGFAQSLLWLYQQDDWN